ncbi:MAG: hypothetical protein HDR21_15090 [Lachnospiraceae bacterium]|nr:hypothetical protein [Lachnospiraceae bacterium]MBD5482223.1 hypothetical protein [Lachnospiraceae bacterium]
MAFVRCNPGRDGGEVINIPQLKAESAMTISTSDQAHIGKTAISINAADYSKLNIASVVIVNNNGAPSSYYYPHVVIKGDGKVLSTISANRNNITVSLAGITTLMFELDASGAFKNANLYNSVTVNNIVIS